MYRRDDKQKTIMGIQILVSTYRERIHDVPTLVRSLPATTPVLVVHQNPPHNACDYPAIFDRFPNVTVISSNERGLAKSRNLGLQHSSGDIIVPTDDDVVFLPGAMDIIDEQFDVQRDAAALTFQITTPDNGVYKRYPRKSHIHTARTITRVSSIEIALRRNWLLQEGVMWDERFGLNGRYGGGLELAFMRNLIAAGCVAKYVPLPIVVHPAVSTGHNHTPESGFFRGAVYAKLYGRWSLPLLAGFAAKNAWRTGSMIGAARYTRNLFRGAADFLKQD